MHKEFAQIRRDRRLAISLIIPPTLQLCSSALRWMPRCRICVGRHRLSHTPESRELISTLTESKSFQPGGYYASADDMRKAISRGKLDAGIVIPYEFARDLQRGTPVTCNSCSTP